MYCIINCIIIKRVFLQHKLLKNIIKKNNKNLILTYKISSNYTIENCNYKNVKKY